MSLLAMMLDSRTMHDDDDDEDDELPDQRLERHDAHDNGVGLSVPVVATELKAALEVTMLHGLNSVERDTSPSMSDALAVQNPLAIAPMLAETVAAPLHASAASSPLRAPPPRPEVAVLAIPVAAPPTEANKHVIGPANVHRRAAAHAEHALALVELASSAPTSPSPPDSGGVSVATSCVSLPTRGPSEMSSQRRFPCSVCSKRFTRRAGVARHMRVHTGEKPYNCPSCSRSFAELGALKRHSRVHSGERPFECTQCKASFAEAGSLKRHIRVHSGERPFKCPICQKGFSRPHIRTKHVKSHSAPPQPKRSRKAKISISPKAPELAVLEHAQIVAAPAQASIVTPSTKRTNVAQIQTLVM